MKSVLPGERRLMAIFLVLVIATVCGIGVANANVFHRYWIRGPIYEAFIRVGGHQFFGDATRDEVTLSDGGKFQEFSRGSSIYWHPDVAGGVAHQIGGAIRNKWGAHGWELGPLGYPTTDELGIPGRTGKFNHFENGSIYWSPETNAQSVSGAIRDYWASRGWEKSHLGLPKSEAELDGDGKVQEFEHGKVRVVAESYSPAPAHQFKPLSSYQMLIPFFPTDIGIASVTAHLSPAGLNQHIVRDFGSFFPLRGCTGRIVVGTECELTTIAGMKERVRVSWIGDTGFGLETLEGSPEGAGRLTTFEFQLIEARSEQKDLAFHGIEHQLLYQASNPEIPWVALRVASSGGIQDAEWSGPFNNRRIATSVWVEFAANTLARVPTMDTVYLVEGLPGLAELIEAFKKQIGRAGIVSAVASNSGEGVGPTVVNADDEWRKDSRKGLVPVVPSSKVSNFQQNVMTSQAAMKEEQARETSVVRESEIR